MRFSKYILVFILFLTLISPISAFAAQAPFVVSDNYLRIKYSVAKLSVQTGQKIRVLIVPGHDDDVHGTAFGDLEEVDFNRVLAQELYKNFQSDPLFDPILTQTQGGYTDTFKNYFQNEGPSIRKFIDSSKRAMAKLLKQGKVEPLDDGVHHNNVSELVGLRLYGMSKWANENNIDLVIHVHFNDYPGRPWNKVGKYSGFTIYVPDDQLQNGKTTQVIAPYVLSALSKYIPISDLGGESGGITKDLELIAVGSNNTLAVPSMLIEYSYMYEPQLKEIKLREKFLKDYAMYTYQGIKNFFENRQQNPIGYDTTFLPHTWSTDLEKGLKNNADVAALQIAMRREGVYPTVGKTLSDCPINGSFGACTEAGVKAFQKKYGISQTGKVGPMTRGKLNSLFGK